MRRILLFILTLLCISVVAQDPCTDAISVTEEYSAVLDPGTHYFVSSTSYLPLTIQIFPLGEEIIAEPKAEFDLTCKPGYYEDEDVLQLIDIVIESGFTLPIKPYLQSITIDEMQGYSIHFNNAVFSQLYVKYGIMKPIEVYVAIKLEQQSLVKLFSESTHALCVNDATSVNLNDSIFIDDGDETAVVEWHVSQWAKDEYAIIWNGQPASFTMGSNCNVKQGDPYTQQLELNGNDTVFMIPEYSAMFLKQFKTPFMYLRHYGGSGWFIMKPYHVPRFIQSLVIGGVHASIDNENMTITAVLPYGTDRIAALQSAECSPALSPLTQTGPEIINDGNTLLFGPLEYDISGVVVDENDHTGISETESDFIHDFTHARVYSATGKLVAEDYSVAQLPSGIYLLRTATASKKIIVY